MHMHMHAHIHIWVCMMSSVDVAATHTHTDASAGLLESYNLPCFDLHPTYTYTYTYTCSLVYVGECHSSSHCLHACGWPYHAQTSPVCRYREVSMCLSKWYDLHLQSLRQWLVLFDVCSSSHAACCHSVPGTPQEIKAPHQGRHGCHI